MNRSRFSPMLVLALAMAFCLTMLNAPARAADHGPMYKVTITNLTNAEVFTPIMVATHKSGVQLYTLGSPASVDVEKVAEAGDLSALEATLRANPGVLSVIDSGAPLPPGQSVTVMVETQGAFDHLSVIAMLIPTNDGFFALNDVMGARTKAELVYYSPAYDAGTEADDELCAHIPGPPNVCTGEGFNPSRDGDGNYVHVHSGIHGIGDLPAATFDWRNPVARIQVERVPGRHS
jgi:hypothetical protein